MLGVLLSLDSAVLCRLVVVADAVWLMLIYLLKLAVTVSVTLILRVLFLISVTGSEPCFVQYVCIHKLMLSVLCD